jgi:hypothetical protein
MCHVIHIIIHCVSRLLKFRQYGKRPPCRIEKVWVIPCGFKSCHVLNLRNWRLHLWVPQWGVDCNRLCTDSIFFILQWLFFCWHASRVFCLFLRFVHWSSIVQVYLVSPFSLAENIFSTIIIIHKVKMAITLLLAMIRRILNYHWWYLSYAFFGLDVFLHNSTRLLPKSLLFVLQFLVYLNND